MFGLSRLLQLAGNITWRPFGKTHWRWQARRRHPLLSIEQMEGRIVPTLLGTQLFPTDYPWNQNIANAPLAANSGAIIAHIGASVGVHPDWGQDSASNGTSALYGIPYNVVHGNSASVTKVNVIIDNYPGESDVLPVPIPANAVIEGDYQNGPNPNGGGYNTGQRGDSHLIVWDEDNNIAYELFGVTRPTDATLFPNTSGVELPHTDGLWHAAQETVWNMNTDTFRSLGDTSADAAGLSILAGLARPDEGLPTSQGGQGAIDHALRVTLPSGDVNPQYIYPASHVVSDSADPDSLPFGARLRLANTPAVNAVISAMQPEAQIIAHAMQQYGLVVADIGGPMFVTGTSASENASNAINLTWNMDDVLGLENLNAGDFQVVNLTPVVTGLSSTIGAAGNTITVVGQNFSGAAGHLSVLFGATPSTAVTFVDDSHITAVVPSGTGTVNVQVQSGVNETDPNNPNDNVNNPIFGYGLSATSTADLFTFSTQTISASNSTVSLGSSTIAPSNIDVVTIVVRDTSDNTISGLTNNSFAFSLAGGTSAGTFGTVTAAPTPGTYTVSFTGAAIGTGSTLTTTVNAVALSASPTITVSATGKLDADHRFVQALYQIVLGRSGSNGELDGWVTLLNQNGHNLSVVTTDIEQSVEARLRLVESWYVTYLGRTGSTGEAMGWVQALANGATEDQVQAQFLGSVEFAARANAMGTSTASANYVRALYVVLFNRVPANTEVNGWLPTLASIGNVGLAQLLLESLERRTTIITGYYNTLFHRVPKPAEVAGWANSSLSLQNIRYLFESSNEFYADA